ncbi:hypothetical protein PanWU01x14_317330 [Parasponia andersonii]|uniref:Uncharacterized protein n=1 Tax=Parasponia andersonii TaxID=3476 RepID=A0A2P5AMN6_PARAD|nr:hypothetical protein PanWU01x14_317330 [Parasponia andersonii]
MEGSSIASKANLTLSEFEEDRCIKLEVSLRNAVVILLFQVFTMGFL